MSQSILKLLSLTGVWVGALGLASFLVLFWVLRGAPVGQAVRDEGDEEAPRGGYRDRVIAAVTLGLMLILAGAYLALTRGVAWSVPAFVLGFGTVFTLVLINQRYRHGSPSLRRAVDLSTATLNASLFAGVLIVVNVLAFRYGGRAIDMTRERAYSLSSQTVGLLRSLNRPVTFTMFYGRGGVAAPQRERVNELLELYRAVNPSRVRIDSVDPDRDLARYEALVKRVPSVDVTQGGGVVVEYGPGETAERQVVRNTDLFEFPNTRFDPNVDTFRAVFKGEDALTTALIRLREGKRTKVVFTTGHGEPSVDDLQSSGQGMGVWKSRLTATGTDVVVVNLLTDPIPDDASVVVVAGPKNPFKPEEASRLEVYSDRKGPVLVLASDAESTGLEGFLRRFQVEIGKGFVVEPRLNLRNNPAAVVALVVGAKHPVVQPLEGQALYLPRSAPLTTTGPPPSPGTRGPRAEPLLRTSRQSWAEPDLKATRAAKDPSDPAGPFTLALAVTETPGRDDPPGPGTPRLVVIGSGYAGLNGVVQPSPPNLDLLMNAVNWLRGEESLLGIAPKTHVALTLTANPAVRSRLILVPTVMSVLLIITVGVATYLARRD